PFWTRCFVLGLTAVAVLVPYGVWNYQHHGRFSLTPLAGFGRAMWSGAEQMGLPAASLPENTWEIHNSIWVERNPRPSPAELITADRQLLDAAMKRIRSAPVAYAKGVGRRVIHMWAGNRYLFPGPDNPINDSLLLRAISIAITVLACLTIVTASKARLPILMAMAPAISLGISLPWMYFVTRYNSDIFGPLSLLTSADANKLKDAMEQKGVVLTAASILTHLASLRKALQP